ncbi:hypothetical protein D3C87_1917810 [compost metagenome]
MKCRVPSRVKKRATESQRPTSERPEERWERGWLAPPPKMRVGKIATIRSAKGCASSCAQAWYLLRM